MMFNEQRMLTLEKFQPSVVDLLYVLLALFVEEVMFLELSTEEKNIQFIVRFKRVTENDVDFTLNFFRIHKEYLKSKFDRI